MAFVTAPDFAIKSIQWNLSRPAQVNMSTWTGKRTVVSDPWHGRWTAKIDLVTIVGEANVLAMRAFFAKVKGSINTFRVFAVEKPQNSNSGVTLSAAPAAGATTVSITGAATTLKAGQFFTLDGQLCLCTIDQAGAVLTFEPPLRKASTIGTKVVTARPYALVYMSSQDMGYGVDPGQVYSISFAVEEAILETDGTVPE